MKKWLLILTALFFVISCKERKPDLSGDASIKPKDFLSAFMPLKLPVTISDKSLSAIADTTTLTYKALTQFVPDSVLDEIVTQHKGLAIHPSGKIEAPNETYLLTNIVDKKQIQLVVFVFNKKTKFTAYKLLLSNVNDDDYIHSVNINKEPTFLISREKTTNNQYKFTRTGWSYSSGNFVNVINDDNETPEKTRVINPIDTFPGKNKLSGDYKIDDKNFVSIRDGKNVNTYLFYLSFNHPNKNCVGELKGEIKVTAPDHAIYQTTGDHCNVDFIFRERELQLKENNMCGNRHGINCTFNDTYEKTSKVKRKK
jgi:hypothetical protein